MVSTLVVRSRAMLRYLLETTLVAYPVTASTTTIKGMTVTRSFLLMLHWERAPMLATRLP